MASSLGRFFSRVPSTAVSLTRRSTSVLLRSIPRDWNERLGRGYRSSTAVALCDKEGGKVLHTPLTTVDPQLVHPPFARYVHACSLPATADAQLVYTSGQLGIRPDGSIPPTIQAQTKVALENIAHVLAAASPDGEGGLSHVLRLNAYVTDRAHLPGYMEARDEILGDLPPTASTLMIVSGFARPEFLVEIEAVAAVPTSPSTRPLRSSRTSVTRTPPGQPPRRSLSMAATRTTRASRHSATTTITTTTRRHLHQDRVAPAAVEAFLDDVRAHKISVLAASDEDENSRREIKRRSKDFYWYSPILKPLLRNRVADLVVLPASEEEVVAVCQAASQHGVPLTTRGAGTGNYGQAVPLRGGAVLDLSRLDRIEMVDAHAGIVRAGAGAKLADIESLARQYGWELRQHPSTRQQATIGGFVAGGSTGHGALLHGGLAEDGAILGLRVVTAEAEPRVLELQGRNVFPVVHAYGTNGIITAVDMPLARAQPWTDATVVFASLREASAFALDVANAPGIVKRAVSVYQAPIPHWCLDADALLHAPDVIYTDAHVDPEKRHVCTVQCSSTSVGAMERLALERGGQVTRIIASEEAPRPYYEFGWNHTTLHAIKKNKATTYLQAVLPPETALDLVDTISNEFDTSELMQHLEVVNFQGRMGFASLSLLWPHGDDMDSKNQRLRDILKWHEDNGMPVFDPHTYILEDGGMKQTDWAQLGFKHGVDPMGILNPGKMRAYEEHTATEMDLAGARGAFTAARRLANTSTVGGGSALSSVSPKNATMAPKVEEPTKPRSRLWAEWSTADFASLDVQEAVAVLPIGAVEAHGPHLPLGVDAMHNKDLLARALAKLPSDITVLALPAMEVGVSCEHHGFAGTLELSAETALAAWCDIGASVARAGIRKLVIYNSHGGNHALAEVVARQLRLKHGMLCVLAMNLSQGFTPEVAGLFSSDEARYGIHGGAVETSLMMHLRPHLVTSPAAEDFGSGAALQPPDAALQIHGIGFNNKTGWLSHDLHPAGVVGAAASESTADKGALLADACVEGLVKLLVEVHASNVDEMLGNTPRYPPQGKY